MAFLVEQNLETNPDFLEQETVVIVVNRMSTQPSTHLSGFVDDVMFSHRPA